MRTKIFTSPRKKTKLVEPAMNTHVRPAYRPTSVPLAALMPGTRRTPAMYRLGIDLKNGGTVFGREWGPDNRFAHAAGWVYIVRMPDGTLTNIKEEDLGKLLPPPAQPDGG